MITKDQPVDEIPLNRTKLSEGWILVKLGDIAYEVSDRVENPSESDLERFVGLEHLESGSFVIRQWGNTADVTSTMKLFQSGDTLFARRNAYLKRASMATFDGVCSGDAIVLREKQEMIVKGFLPLILNTEELWHYAIANAAGSMSKRVKWHSLAEYEFALPPKDEQRRIADILWAADETIEYQIRIKEALENCARNLTNDLVNKGLSDWMVVELGEIAEVAYGLTINGERRKLIMEKPYLRVANVMRGLLDLNEIKFIGCTFEDINKFALHYGDVLVVEGHASVDEIGRATLWHGEIAECLHQNHILRARCHSNLIPEYLVIYLNSPHGKKYIQQHAKSSSGLNTINSTVLKQIPVPLPSLETQKSFVEVTQKFEQSIKDAKNHIASLIQLKKALLSFLLASN